MNDDILAIETLVHALGEAFNAKDAKAFAGLFTADAEFVTIFGLRMRGRADIEAGHAAVFAHALAGNRMVVRSFEPKLLAADVALCHASWARERLPDAPEGGACHPAPESSRWSRYARAATGRLRRQPTCRMRPCPGRSSGAALSPAAAPHWL
ncbi:MAG: SgcJ/EcaC family oxidoreductase [Verrucomicrobia bacterium]|nr:SgcJ/EcaC family oxidoreductase [Verrucomicrobiota bacterium]